MAYKAAHNKYRDLWKRDNGPKINKWDIDYSYYSPMDYGADKNKKYPLCIILVGALEGLFEGLEIQANEMPLWCDEKYQSRFNNGGAYLMIPRAPEEDGIYWDQSCLTESLKGAIVDFCKKHENVDTSRIYLLGWCLGSLGAINLAAAYPELFAATVLMAPDRAVTKSEAQRLREMPVWLMAAKTDTHSFYHINALPTWKLLRDSTENKSNLRLTTYLRAVDVYLVHNAVAMCNHNLWDNVSEDMHFEGVPYDRDKIISGSYKGMKTVDGNGTVLYDPYIISWLNKFTNDGRSAIQTPKHNETTSEKAYIYFNESFMHEVHQKTFAVLGVIYRKLGWLK